MRIAVLGLSALMLTGVAAADDINREGSGSHRAVLDRMELQPFPNDMWANLKDWRNGEYVPADAEGKVVLIVTFASWNPTSHRALSSAGRLARRNADADLIVIGVHHEKGWDGADAVLEKKKVKFPVAHDAGGSFRLGLHVDQDPDFYLIDRAGHLRFADITSDDVSKAVSMLLEESAEDARDVPTRLASDKRSRDIESRRTSGLKETITPGTRLNVEFTPPAEDSYEGVDWPKWWVKTEYDKVAETYSTDPPTLSMSEDESVWVPDPVGEHPGKLIVAYLFDPRRPALMGIIPTMERIQRNEQRDVSVIGIAYNMAATDGGNLQGEQRQKLIKRNRDAVRDMLENRSINHRILLDPPETDKFKQELPVRLRTTGDDFTLCMILSTDNKVRYIGHPKDDSFRAVLQKLKNVDPGVLARRKAEEAYIKARGQ